MSFFDRKCVISIFFAVLLSAGILPVLLLAEDSANQQLTNLIFPETLSNNIYNESFIKRQHNKYKRIIHSESGDIERSALVWRPDNFKADFAINEVQLAFQTTDRRFKENRFNIRIRYQGSQVVEIIHSKPRLPRHSSGVLVRYSPRIMSAWGGVIYGLDSAGIIFFVGRNDTKDKTVPPVLICPRFIATQGNTFLLDAADSELIAVSGQFSGQAAVQFRAGYADGDASLEYLTQGLPRNLSEPVQQRARMPKVALAYEPDLQQPSSISVEKKQPVAISLTALAQLRNAAGFVKQESHSAAIWVSTYDQASDQEFDITMSPNIKKSVRVKRGQCALVFEAHHIHRNFSAPEDSSN